MFKQQMQYVLIPETSLEVINEKLIEQNYGLIKGKLKLKNVLLIFGFILNQVNKADNGDLDRGHLPIHHKVLEKQYSDHYKCTRFLVKNKLLHRFNYSNQGKKCSRYALHNDYRYKKNISVDISSPFSALKADFIANCDDNSEKKYKYLIKHFKNVSINHLEAKKYIDDLYPLHKIPGHKHEYKHNSCTYSIDAIKDRLFYFRIPDTDKRLHTNLTSMKKELRHFLRYNGKPLVNLDIKNSQPYCLAVIINIILNKDKSTLYKLKPILKCVKSKKASKPTNYYKIISELFDAKFDNKELNLYIKSVCNGNYYELLVQKLESYFKYEGGVLVKEKYNKKTGEIEKDDYETKRAYAKNSSMQILFASEKSTVKDVTFFKNEFPALWELTKALKGNESSNFAVLLQNLEAHLVLEKITKIADNQFNAPLFTIHDSIATTKEYVNGIIQLVHQVLLETVKLTPKIEIENW